MRVAGLEFDELAGKGSDHVPRTLAGLARLNIAEIHLESRRRNELVVDASAGQLSNDEETREVLNDFWLLRIDRHLASHTVARVLNEHAHGKRDWAFDLRSERVIALHIARHEISDFELRIGLHVDRRWNREQYFLG